ncbi:ABC transporter permease [Legionella geestiana]|uniref:ABC transporter permease n=1 Tax=Legionella geestiana TaxID=45065 RepID=A0A0W0TPB2_9GAMM|nr:DMT family transporter [Legionella geestiana]KTC97404.1 ABC transporter permease [Legionella geestiana]QBS11417.1 DMT family transporter [Legionella geestiana]QDQ38974.1 DMT family transporter [Legionella geestiana]STX53924.1 ABC transporter, transmembrane permease,permeases of drug/metabolite transporter type [Legionella geestiana]
MKLRFFNYPLVLLVLLGFIWGCGYSLSRYALTHGVPPLGYAFWQTLGPALLLGVTGGFRRGGRLRNPADWRFFLICGLAGIAIPNTNMYFLAPHLPAGMLAVLVNTVPLIIYPMAIFLGLERFESCRFSAVLLGVFGLMSLVTAPLSVNVYTLAALLTPLAFAACSLYIANLGKQAPEAHESACGMLLAATLLLLPLVLSTHSFYPLSVFPDTVQSVVLLEILLSTIGYVLFFRLIRLAGPVFYSLVGGVVALTGIFWGRILFDERLTLRETLACACITGAVFLLSWRQSRLIKGEAT